MEKRCFFLCIWCFVLQHLLTILIFKFTTPSFSFSLSPLLFVWAQFTAGSDSKLSFLANMISDNERSVASKRLVVLVFLAYMIACTYSSLFRLSIANFYEILPHRTDGKSASINARYCMAFAPALGYNFLTLVHETHDKLVNQVHNHCIF